MARAPAATWLPIPWALPGAAHAFAVVRVRPGLRSGPGLLWGLLPCCAVCEMAETCHLGGVPVEAGEPRICCRRGDSWMEKELGAMTREGSCSSEGVGVSVSAFRGTKSHSLITCFPRSCCLNMHIHV